MDGYFSKIVNIGKYITIAAFIGSLFHTQVRAQDKFLEFTGGAVVEAAILFSTVKSIDQISARHYFYGTVGAITGTIIVGKIILNKDGSIPQAIVGGTVGGIAGSIVGLPCKNFVFVFTAAPNMDINIVRGIVCFIGFIGSFALPPLGSVKGFNHKKNKATAILNLHQGDFVMGFPNLSMKVMGLIEGNRQVLYQISLISFRW